jgi:hypothetical protein
LLETLLPPFSYCDRRVREANKFIERQEDSSIMKGRYWAASAGLVFVVAWVIGLLIEPGAPASTASAAQVTAYFLAHQQAQLIQSYLIDGIAGAALIVFAAALKNFLQKFDGESTLPDVVFGAAVAAASVSLFQAACGEALANHDALTSGGAGAIKIVFVLLNEADTFKLLALAILIGAASIFALPVSVHRITSRALPQWLGWLGFVLALVLIVGGLSFTLNNSALYYLLYVGLPLLLLWVAAVSVVVLWRTS